MSSRFVSAGAIDAASGEAVNVADQVRADGSAVTATNTTARQGEWEAVQKELDADRRRRDEERRKAAEANGAGGERSLYEVLQANKAAKQAAFEEKNKIKNQFRPLDDAEVDFLDDVRSSEREKEARLRRETQEGLDAFRAAQRQREAGLSREDGGTDGALRDVDGEVEDDWAVAVGRKRKREKEKEGRGGIKGLKRQASDVGKQTSTVQSMTDVASKKEASQQQTISGTKWAEHDSPPAVRTESGQNSKPKLGLVDYGSDDDSDD